MTRIFSEEHRRKISEAQTRRLLDPEARRAISERMQGNQHSAGPHVLSKEGLLSLRQAVKTGANWRGGAIGEEFAQQLCPAGFTREYHLYFGPNNSRQFVLDFAHVGEKINIELDGPMHMGSLKEDARRDAVLQSMGWLVIRVVHP